MTHVTSQVASPGITPASPVATPVFVCIDVAKDKLDVARSDSRQLVTVDNNEKGIGQIIKLFKAASPTCIVVEATGGFEPSRSTS